MWLVGNVSVKSVSLSERTASQLPPQGPSAVSRQPAQDMHPLLLCLLLQDWVSSTQLLSGLSPTDGLLGMVHPLQ